MTVTITITANRARFEAIMRRAPVCGVAAQAVRRQLLQNGPREPLAPSKKTFQSYNVKPKMGIERNLNPKEMYSQIRRSDDAYRSRDRFVPTRKPKLMHGAPDLSAIQLQEMSPIRSSSFSTNTSSEVPQMLSSTRAPADWKPQLTSTTTSFQPLSPLDKDDSDIQFKAPNSPVYSSTPCSDRLYRKRPNYGRHCAQFQLSERLDSRMESLSGSRGNSSLEESLNQEPNRPTTSDPWSESNNENMHPSSMEPISGKNIRPESFGLNNVYAKHKDIRGIVFLGMSLCGRRLTLNVQKAFYFRSGAQSVCSYVSAVLCHRSQPSSLTSRKYRQKPDEAYRTRLVTNSNSPSFDESFHFTLSESCSRDFLIVTIYEMDSGNADKKKLLGCMTFPVNRLLKKASQVVGDQFYHQRRGEPVEEIEINNEGFFLLNRDQGKKQNFPQRKVRRQTYYEDPAFTGHSSASSSVISNNPEQMTATSPRLSVPNELTLNDYYRSSNDIRVLSTQNLLDYTTASSSTNGSVAPEQLKFHRATLPSITTTNSENNTNDSKSLSPERLQDRHYLCSDDAGGVYGAGPAHTAYKKTSVRRAASFTFSPKNSKTNLRQLNVREESDKRRFLGPISRTLSYIKNKMDTLSTSTLYPTREEVRQWENTFEALIYHKHGCALFHQFLRKEFSDENIQFWLECEEFKKMKDGKKSTTQKALEIYTEFVAEHSPKEVNLDSDTRAATKAALENGCKPDTFALAQSRVEQLMSKDSYRRFLRDRIFLDFLESYETGDKKDEPTTSAVKDKKN
uniref:RGS domain-containing protein n=1 Tax=Caenorhabditis japonica TaxID=281687 RepID=A0A8R1DVW4_CAEJA